MVYEGYKEQEISCYDKLTYSCVEKSITIIQDENISSTSLPPELY